MLRNKLRFARAFLPSLLFNIYALPLRQAIRMPILVYRLKLYSVGKIIIDAPKLSFGMIRLGYFITPQYPNNGIRWDNRGCVVFKGRACIGSNSALFTGRESAIVEFGDNFVATTTLHLNCDNKIKFGENVLIGWNVTIFDSAMHRLKDADGNFKGEGYDQVVIGNDNWLATDTIVMPGTKTPHKCVCSAGSLLNSDYSSLPGKVLLAGKPAVMKREGVWLDMADCAIEYKQ